MTLPTALLGATGLNITRVGFGAWAIGGAEHAFGWGAQDDDESVAAIRHAVEHGVNWIDTAAVYGRGHSEQIVARALTDFSDGDRPYVFTKCGMVWDPDTAPLPTRVGAPESIRREVDGSLRRLTVDRIDLYQLHWPPNDGTPIEDSVATLHELRAEGKIRLVGVSNVNVELLERAAYAGGVDVLQPPFSAIRRTVATDVLPYCAKHNIGVIVYSPMQSGLLTGAWTAQRSADLPADDWRRGSADFTGEALHSNLALADILRTVAKRHDTTVAAVAVAWTLTFDGVSAAIVGARRPAQVDGWIAGAGLALTADDLDDIELGIDRLGVGAGPSRPTG
ncbi:MULTISPECIES: aldo/keto reductase [unclassified Frankia]|uniref:aldo/keto reductase n=1 Tax=unclassified Frankia TaxID=2632575 RepID=UPI002AD28BCF|nr:MULTISPECIES: aldo/keto reductase [unclassified Frankia]